MPVRAAYWEEDGCTTKREAQDVMCVCLCVYGCVRKRSGKERKGGKGEEEDEDEEGGSTVWGGKKLGTEKKSKQKAPLRDIA